MSNALLALRLSVRQFLEAVGDDNRFYTSRALNKRWEDTTVEDCVAHYVANAPVGMTVYGFDVAPRFTPQSHLELPIEAVLVIGHDSEEYDEFVKDGAD